MDDNYVLGIDIGSANIKAMVASVDGHGMISVLGTGIVPTEGFSKGNITDMGALVKSVQQAVDCVTLATQFSGGIIYLGVGGLNTACWRATGTVAPLSPKAVAWGDIERASRAAVAASVGNDQMVLHAIPRTLWIDGQKQAIIPDFRGKGSRLDVDVLIITASKVLVEELIAELRLVGVCAEQIVSTSFIGAQSLEPEDLQNSLYVDIGACFTNLVFYQSGIPIEVACLRLGGNYITNDIMQSVGVSYNHAEEIKKYYSRLDENLYGKKVILNCNDDGTEDKYIHYDFLAHVINSRVDEITDLIYEHIKSNLYSADLENIALTGGCVKLPGIKKRFENTFKIPVKIIVPEKVPAEYAQPGNTVTFGMMRYFSKHKPTKRDTGSTYFQSIIGKVIRAFSCK